MALGQLFFLNILYLRLSENVSYENIVFCVFNSGNGLVGFR
ncbi:MAG: hypothetical protein ACJAYS_000943 [Lentimonas sp.]|jgi:hypothetical protein